MRYLAVLNITRENKAMSETEVKEQKSGLLLFAEQELARIPKDDDDMQEKINRHILDMVKVFCEEKHSGFTASYTVNILERLLRYLPLSAIEDTPEYWKDVGAGYYQHRRCSRVFKNKSQFEGKAYILEAKVFSNDGGKTWFTNSNSREVIEFPYTVPARPRRYLVDGDGTVLSEYTALEENDSLRRFR
jgi:hypothetical protein